MKRNGGILINREEEEEKMGFLGFDCGGGLCWVVERQRRENIGWFFEEGW